MARLAPEEGFGVLEEREETWRPINGFYAVSDHGRVKRTVGGPGAKPGRILQPSTNKGGYEYVVMSVGGKRITKTVHSLVAVAFSGERPEGLEINHKDGCKTNNRSDNLEYVTQANNILHARVNGLYCRGEDHGRSKLSAGDVNNIRHLLDCGEPCSAIARKFGVTRSAVSKIKHGKNWQESCHG